MSIESKLSQLNIKEDEFSQNYQYIDVFKNPNKLPINQIYLEKRWRELRKVLPKNFNYLSASVKEIENLCYEKKTKLIPALDKQWLPKAVLTCYEPYSFSQDKEENISFLVQNVKFLDSLDHLLNCNFHQFWCLVLFEPSATVSLRSYILNPILPYQVRYLADEFLDVYKAIFNKFMLVYEKLFTFKQSEVEYMSESFGLCKLIDKKLLNLPIVITLAFLYKEYNLTFVNNVAELYFYSDNCQANFLLKEVETMIDQNLIILEMIGGHLCGFDDKAVIVPLSIGNRPSVFSLSWIYSVVTYLLSTILTTNILMQFYEPAKEIALNKKFPFRLPFIYVSVYKELYELLNEREEAKVLKELYTNIIEEINVGRAEFVELYHTFVSYCLDEALKHMGDNTKQEVVVEKYLNLLTTALEDEYFICDYNAAYNVTTQNEMFESCCDIDPTRTGFIISCINKLPRNKKLQEISKLKHQTVESVFRDFAPPVIEKTQKEELPQPGPSNINGFNESDIEEKIRNIMDMFPHLGDGFILQCLECYNYNSSDVINAILEGNLPPHLSEIPFDQIRIPPEPEPEKPVLAYKGKKPDYDDALKLLNDKRDIKEIKNLVLEGVQFQYDSVYDDEYDDRFDDDVAIPVADNPLDKELAIFNPNRTNKNESECEGEDENEEQNTANRKSNLNFCEDPAVLRERREARFRSKQPPRANPGPSSSKSDVVGKPKGHGQEKSTLLSRQKKNVNKSSRANHNRKSGAQWKRNKGMIPS